MLIVRELTGGSYFGAKTRTATTASDLCIYTTEEIERVARVAFKAAEGRRNHVTLVDKANVLETSRLWRETVTALQKREFPRVALEYVLVDTAAMRLIQKPRAFDVVLTENMFGDILSDEASMLPGSIGLLGSASLGAAGPGLFEPIHGSAPDIAGMDLCNPTGAILSAAMLLRYGLGREEEATDAGGSRGRGGAGIGSGHDRSRRAGNLLQLLPRGGGRIAAGLRRAGEQAALGHEHCLKYRCA